MISSASARYARRVVDGADAARRLDARPMRRPLRGSARASSAPPCRRRRHRRLAGRRLDEVGAVIDRQRATPRRPRPGRGTRRSRGSPSTLHRRRRSVRTASTIRRRTSTAAARGTHGTAATRSISSAPSATASLGLGDHGGRRRSPPAGKLTTVATVTPVPRERRRRLRDELRPDAHGGGRPVRCRRRDGRAVDVGRRAGRRSPRSVRSISPRTRRATRPERPSSCQRADRLSFCVLTQNDGDMGSVGGGDFDVERDDVDDLAALALAELRRCRRPARTACRRRRCRRSCPGGTWCRAGGR